jgi:hypothetical protein
MALAGSRAAHAELANCPDGWYFACADECDGQQDSWRICTQRAFSSCRNFPGIDDSFCGESDDCPNAEVFCHFTSEPVQ